MGVSSEGNGFKASIFWIVEQLLKSNEKNEMENKTFIVVIVANDLKAKIKVINVIFV